MPFNESVKTRVRQRAHFICCLCRAKAAIEVHHITPQEEGGPDTEENAAPLCPSCHALYGGNPELRRFIRESRDFWLNWCDRHLSPDAQQHLEEIKLLLAKVPSAEDFRTTLMDVLSAVRGQSLPLQDWPGDELEEQPITFKGMWRGSWVRLAGGEEGPASGSEIVQVREQDERNNISGEFYDDEHPSITFAFTGVYKMSFLRVRYKAPRGQNVMEDGSCFVKLRPEGYFKGYYANFDACGEYELRRIT